MTKAELKTFVDGQIASEQKKTLSNPHSKLAEMSSGELSFYMALCRVLDGQATRQDLGMMDAINDTLQKLNLMDERKTFLSGV